MKSGSGVGGVGKSAKAWVPTRIDRPAPPIGVLWGKPKPLSGSPIGVPVASNKNNRAALNSGKPDPSTHPNGPVGSASPLCWQFSSSTNMVSSMNWIAGLPLAPATTSLIWTK